MNLNDVLQLYNCGHFYECHTMFENKSAIQLDSKLSILDETTKDLLCKSNAVLCQAIIKEPKSSQNWLDSMSSFSKMYSNYRSLTTIPLDLELNVVYNILWWFCVKPLHLEYKTFHVTYILDSISKCLIKVLKYCGVNLLGQEFCSDNAINIVSLLKQTSDVLLHLQATVSMQLLGVITLTVHVLLKQDDAGSIAECMCLLRKMIDQLELLRLCVQRETVSGNEEIYFKFGLTSVNSTASLKNSGDVIDAFVITGSLVCAISGEFKHAMDCLKQVSERGNQSFKFLSNYLKAYCCLQSQYYGEAKLCLAYTASTSLPPRYKSHYQILLARLLSEQEDPQGAIVQCDHVLASTSPQARLCSLAAHLASEQAQKLNLCTAQFNYLKQLIQCLKLSLSEDDTQFEGFEDWCLSLFCEQFYISLHEATYLLARQLYLAGFHVIARDSYCELLELVKSEFFAVTEIIPCKTQLLQEAVLAYMKTNSFKEGEQLCRQLIKGYVPNSTAKCRRHGEQRCWETALYCLDEDILSMTLLADFLAQTNKKKAFEELNRCHNTLSEAREQAEEKTDVPESLKELCNWLLSRILLRKARLSTTMDASHYFRRALNHKPGDKEVMFHYKQWALWHPDHQSFDPGDQVHVFPVDQVNNLALRHVLGCSVTNEEWAAFFDQESSQNVLESLFDDDTD